MSTYTFPTPAEMRAAQELVAEYVWVRTRLRENALADDLIWILPADLLPGVTQLYGVPVQHATVPAPVLAHRLPAWEALQEQRRAVVAATPAEAEAQR